MLQFIVRTLFLLIFPLVVLAQETPLFNQVHLDAQAEREVENDQLEVVLMVQEEGVKPDEIATRVNETMQWALQVAGADEDIEVSTRSYQTYPVYNDRFIVGWRASQELYLRSEKISDLTELVGQLQQKLQVNQMNFSPTKATRTRIENELISEAMLAFRQRADVIKGHMDNMDYRIVNIQVSAGQAGPVMYRESVMAMAKMADAAMAPAVEAGTSKVIVTVSGSIQFF